MLTPEEVSEPAIRTIGKGCMSLSAGGITLIVSPTTPERPSASVTRSCTRCFPGVENDLVITGPPARNGSLLVRAHAKAVIGLAVSVELDTNRTGSPVCGAVG